MKIIFLSRWFPWPANNGSRLRISNIIRCLAKEHTIDLVSFTQPEATTDLNLANKHCRRIKIVSYQDFQPRQLKSLLGFLYPWPRSVIATHSLAMQRAVTQLTQNQHYDVVIASEWDMATYALEIPRSQVSTRLIEDIEITTLYEQQNQTRNPLKRIRLSLMWYKWSNYINYLVRNCDGYTSVSDPELARITSVLRSPADKVPHQVIPNGVQVNHYQGNFGKPKAGTLIYTGALSYGANFDAVNFFLQDIWPLILAQNPQTKFSITGKLKGIPLDQLPQSPNVTFTGYLPDVRPAIAQSWLNIVPLRIGGGTRLKILESLALQTPVVATQKGAEGLELCPDKDILIADQPEAFAEAVTRLLSDPSLRQSLSQQGFRAISRYDWDTIGDTLQEFLLKITANATRE